VQVKCKSTEETVIYESNVDSLILYNLHY